MYFDLKKDIMKLKFYYIKRNEFNEYRRNNEKN